MFLWKDEDNVGTVGAIAIKDVPKKLVQPSYPYPMNSCHNFSYSHVISETTATLTQIRMVPEQDMFCSPDQVCKCWPGSTILRPQLC